MKNPGPSATAPSASAVDSVEKGETSVSDLYESAMSRICFIKDVDTEFPTSPQTNAWFGKAELCYA